MANILDRYGIKEVCDVTFYRIAGSADVEAAVKADPAATLKVGDPMEPVLYLDSLKISTVEQTADNTSARGGKGNPELIIWDFGKEISLNLQDALFSAKSMAVMFGDQNFGTDSITATGKILRTWNIFGLYDTAPTTLKHGTKDITVPESAVYYTATGEKEQQFNKATSAFVTFEVEAKDVMTIKINPDTFSGTYYVTGDTYARSEDTGEDEFFQVQIPKAKMLSEVTLTMEAEGDPSVFDMNMKVLRPKTGEMLRLVKYDI